jgi:hypothetical protein
MATMDPAQAAFIKAQQAFRDKLNDPGLYQEILTTTKVEDVYEITGKIQEDAAKKGRLRYLARIKPFLDGLSSFADVIEIFIQAKPDLLALIWGPIKLILLWSSQITSVLDKIADAMAKIGHALPQFKMVAYMFGSNKAVNHALTLFYEDILDFYRINFDFFLKTRKYTSTVAHAIGINMLTV